MSNNIFQLAGKVNVPTEKREEMNRHVLKIMDKCGIRKTEEITVAGEKVTVIGPARPNANGIVLFDYSIFEKTKRKISTYDLNTCELYTEDAGYSEFGIVMNMIMVLQESYTNGGCYFIKSGRLYDVEIYLRLIQGVLGEKVALPGRIRMWDVYLFFRNSEECQSVTYDELLNDYFESYGALDIEQLLAVMEVEKEALIFPDKKTITHRDEISSAAPCSRTEYAYRVFCGMNEAGKNAVKDFLEELLNSDFTKRKELSVRQDESGIIAELSLYVLSARLVLAYAQAAGTDFWELWDSLGGKGYSDIVQKKAPKDAGDDFRTLPFYKAILRNDEDEFLEFWDGSNLILSQNMESCIRRWKEAIDGISAPCTISTVHFLAKIIARLERSGCRYVDKIFVTEFMEHGEDPNYQRAIILLQQLLNKGQEYFPELTGGQVDEWILRGARDRFDYVEISAFVSLLTNRRQRNIVFEF